MVDQCHLTSNSGRYSRASYKPIRKNIDFIKRNMIITPRKISPTFERAGRTFSRQGFALENKPVIVEPTPRKLYFEVDGSHWQQRNGIFGKFLQPTGLMIQGISIVPRI